MSKDNNPDTQWSEIDELFLPSTPTLTQMIQAYEEVTEKTCVFEEEAINTLPKPDSAPDGQIQITRKDWRQKALPHRLYRVSFRFIHRCLPAPPLSDPSSAILGGLSESYAAEAGGSRTRARENTAPDPSACAPYSCPPTSSSARSWGSMNWSPAHCANLSRSVWIGTSPIAPMLPRPSSI